MWNDQTPTPFIDAIMAFANARGQTCTAHDANALLRSHILNIADKETILERDAARYILCSLAQYGPKVLFPYQ